MYHDIRLELIQFYSILFYSILFYSILFYSILFYSILFYSILFYSIEYKLRSGASFRLFALVLIYTTCNLITSDNPNKTLTRLI